MSLEWFASCPRGLEDLLMAEARDIIPKAKLEVSRGGIRISTHEKDALDFLMESRLSSRLFISLRFDFFKHEQNLYKKATQWPWEKWMDARQTFKITTILDPKIKKDFKSALYLSQLMKDGLVDRLKEKQDIRPSVALQDPDLNFQAHITKGKKGDYRVDFSLDICGRALSDRQYRQPGHPAPLRENLAAALVKMSDWNPEEDIFVDPFCGSGTLIFEAAMIKANAMPSLLKSPRDFSFNHQKWFKEKEDLDKWFQDKFYTRREESFKALKKIEAGQFFACDFSGKSLYMVRRTLPFLKLDGAIEIMKSDATKLSAPEDPPGVVLTNPPYGERMEQPEKVKELIHEFSENLKNNFKGYRAHIILPHGDLRKVIKLATTSKKEVFNGNLDCRLLRYDLY